ncbi:MAG: glycerophosphodiester phosphodiesterase family protein [Acidimicrobiales bacterium]
MRRALLVTVLPVLPVLLLAACGGDGSATDTTAAPSTATTEPAADTTVDTTAATAAATTELTSTVPTTDPDATVPESSVAGVPDTSGALLPRPATIDELLSLARPVVLGHAGGEDEFPHSTPFAFANSVYAGVDVLDMDVQLTGDGVLIVQHDDTVDRTTDGTGAVADMTYDEISQLDNAYWFTADCVCTDQPEDAYVYRGIRTGDRPAPTGFTADDFRIPRFRDIVEQWPDMPLNIEIKGDGASSAAAAVELAAELRELGRLDAAVVTSFDDAAVDAFAAAAPEVELTPGLGLSTGWVLDRTPLPEGMRILQLPIEYDGLQVITPELIADSHAAGYVIWVWPNDRAWENLDRYRELLDMGLDGLNINFPRQGVTAMSMFIGAYG